MKDLIHLIRMPQWVKNIFVWIPAFFAGILFQGDVLIRLCLGFLAFGFLASSIYIINDYNDVAQDRLHPLKRHRPLAAGTVNRRFALVLSVVLLVSALLIGYSLSHTGFYILAVYFILNLLYTFFLKKIAIVDIVIIAFGFLLRVLFGIQIIGIATSKWLVLMTFLLALFLGLAKRRDEFIIFAKGIKSRDSMTGYNLPFLDASLVFTASIATVSYLMYTISDEVVHHFQTDYLYITAIPVIVGLLRYLQLSLVLKNSGSPTKVLLHDRFTQCVILIWIALFFFIIYRHTLDSFLS